MTTWRRGFNVISTEERVKPERSGEIPNGRKKYRSEAIVFAPARSLDYARDDEARGAFRLVWRRDEGVRPYQFYRRERLKNGRSPLPRSTEGKDLKTGVRPYHALPKVSTGIADLPAGAPCRRDEGVPPYRGDITPAKDLSYTSKLPTGGRGRPPLPALTIVTVVTRQPHYFNLFRPLKRCGCDTAASVPAAFLLLFSPLEKSSISPPFFLKENICYYFQSKP